MTRSCRSCRQPRPEDHDFCFVCGARLGHAVLPSNRKGFRFAGISINAPRLINRTDRLGERPAPQTLATWLSRRWAEVTLLAVVLWALQSQSWIPVAIEPPAIHAKPDSWLARLALPTSPSDRSSP